MTAVGMIVGMIVVMIVVMVVVMLVVMVVAMVGVGMPREHRYGSGTGARTMTLDRHRPRASAGIGSEEEVVAPDLEVVHRERLSVISGAAGVVAVVAIASVGGPILNAIAVRIDGDDCYDS